MPPCQQRWHNQHAPKDHSRLGLKQIDLDMLRKEMGSLRVTTTAQEESVIELELELAKIEGLHETHCEVRQKLTDEIGLLAPALEEVELKSQVLRQQIEGFKEQEKVLSSEITKQMKEDKIARARLELTKSGIRLKELENLNQAKLQELESKIFLRQDSVYS
jgi:chromosome segregation ATPase